MRSSALSIHQYLPRLAWGDAVGNQVRFLQTRFRRWGARSEIFADAADPECAAQCLKPEAYRDHADASSVLLIHHSFESRRLSLLARAPGRKVLAYHNVTPASLFEGFDRRLVEACRAARDELHAMREWIERAYAFSSFSAEELVAAGFKHVEVLPFPVDLAQLEVPPDEALRAEFSDGCANILFVGRSVPSKGLDDVLRVFTAFQRLHRRDSRLIVAGYFNRDTPYGAWLLTLRELLGAERVHFLGRVSEAQLSACYQASDAYLSMSRHEGFGVPLLEAMHRSVPVIALGAAAVPETLAGSGVVTLSDDPVDVAALLAAVVNDRRLRERIIAEQHARARQFAPDALWPLIEEKLAPLRSAPDAGTSEVMTQPSIDLIAPGALLFPDATASKFARALAARLGERARLHVLATDRAISTGTPIEKPEKSGAIRVEYTADQPRSRIRPEALPHSSALEAAARRRAGARLVVIGGSIYLPPTIEARAIRIDVASLPSSPRELDARADALVAELPTMRRR